MTTFPALKAKEAFGQFLDAALRGPVTVTKNGRPVAVLLSVEDYVRMRGDSRRRLLDTIAAAHLGALNED